MIQTWDRLLTLVAERLGPDERLPGFPIWADEWRSLESASDLIDVAAVKGAPFPAWKKNFLLKNAEFYDRHREVLDKFRMELDAFPPSRRKFEWQAGPHRPLAETIMHFRPSGIRAKRPDYVPALVAITQTSIMGDRRRLTPRETARLQGLPDTFEFVKTDSGHPRARGAGRSEGLCLLQADGQWRERRRRVLRLQGVRPDAPRGDRRRGAARRRFGGIGARQPGRPARACDLRGFSPVGPRGLV